MKLLTITIFAVALSIGLSYSVTFAQNGGPAEEISLYNPLGETSSVMDVINRIIGGLQIVATPIVALMVLIGAFQILFAGGNPDKFATGKKTIIYAVVGYAIIWIAGGIATLIANIISG